MATAWPVRSTCGCAAVHLPSPLVDGPTVDRAHAAGLAVAAWTVADGDDLAAVLAAGVDTVITDDVALARRAVDGPERPPPDGALLTWDGGRDWSSEGRFSSTMHDYERRRLCEADPRSRRSAGAGSGTKTLVRDGKLILDDSDAYGVEMALQLADAAGGGEVTLVSMAPNGEVVGPAHRPGHGCRQGHPGQRPGPGRHRRPRDRQGAGRRHPAGRARPGPGRHRVDRRLHRHHAGADRRAPGPARRSPSPRRSRSTASSVKVERQTEAGYDEVECPLPAVVTVTAGVVEPRYPSFKGIMAAKSKPVDNLTVADLGIDAGQVGAAGARQEITDVAAAEARAGR